MPSSPQNITMDADTLHGTMCHGCVISGLIRSLWYSDAIWNHRTWSILFQVMAGCLTALSHYLNQWYRIVRYRSAITIKYSRCHSQKVCNFTHSTIQNRSTRDQWVNTWLLPIPDAKTLIITQLRASVGIPLYFCNLDNRELTRLWKKRRNLSSTNTER